MAQFIIFIIFGNKMHSEYLTSKILQNQIEKQEDKVVLFKVKIRYNKFYYS